MGGRRGVEGETKTVVWQKRLREVTRVSFFFFFLKNRKKDGNSIIHQIDQFVQYERYIQSFLGPKFCIVPIIEGFESFFIYNNKYVFLKNYYKNDEKR